MFNKLQTGTAESERLVSQRLEGVAAIVLIKLQLTVNRFNMVKGQPAYLSRMWGMTIGEFTLGIRALKRYDMIRKYTKTEYMLNPAIMYNGQESQYYIVKHMWDNQTSRGLKS
jgi:hypothetical protein